MAWMIRSKRWDVFCHVVDNFGDIGVCWRLAADLASRGQEVRLRTDDASALAWMAPAGADGVRVLPFDDRSVPPGDVVIEAFGCSPPAEFVEAMAAGAPVWINLEYLSAESYVERAHQLPSPQWHGPGAGLVKYFFYPGFTPRTGGLLREPDLARRQREFDPASWLHAQGAAPRAGERTVSLFCYEQPAVDSLLDLLAGTPSLLLVTAGSAGRQVRQVLGSEGRRGALRSHFLPALSQHDYDHLLWASELNFVRGEDSFVRAQWAGRPFVWQIYPQADGIHLAKLDAFLDRFGASLALRAFWHAWNGSGAMPLALPDPAQWGPACENWRARLLAQRDLSSQLVEFVAETS